MTILGTGILNNYQVTGDGAFMRTLPKVKSCRLGSEGVFEAQRFGFGAVAENKLRQNIAESILDDKRVLGGSWEFSKQVHKGDTWSYCMAYRGY